MTVRFLKMITIYYKQLLYIYTSNKLQSRNNLVAVLALAMAQKYGAPK